MNYQDAIAEGRRLYAEAMDKAANYALFVTEEFDRPLQTVCKEIADEGWNALRVRAQRIKETAGQTPDERARAQKKAAQESAQRHAKVTLKDPEQAAKVIASLPPETLQQVARTVNRAAAAAHETTERLPQPKATPDYDRRYQDAASEIVYREADRRAGRWTPSEQTEGFRHFLLRALTDSGPIDADALLDEITAYLEEVG